MTNMTTKLHEHIVSSFILDIMSDSMEIGDTYNREYKKRRRFKFKFKLNYVTPVFTCIMGFILHGFVDNLVKNPKRNITNSCDYANRISVLADELTEKTNNFQSQVKGIVSDCINER